MARVRVFDAPNFYSCLVRQSVAACLQCLPTLCHLDLAAADILHEPLLTLSPRAMTDLKTVPAHQTPGS